MSRPLLFRTRGQTARNGSSAVKAGPPTIPGTSPEPARPWRLVLRLEHQKVRNGGATVRVFKTGVLLAVDPDRVGLPRLQLHRQHAGPLVLEILRLAVDLGEALLR